MTALLLAFACTSGKPGTSDSTPDASEYAGSYSGEVHGYAAFEEDWEETPYCSGSMEAEVTGDGTVTGTGDCEITWGPAMGESFEATLSGAVAGDGSYGLTLSFAYETEARGWDEADIEGDASEGLSGRGESVYHPDGLDDLDAWLELLLD